MSQRGHGPAMMKYAADFPETELTACCDTDIERAEEFCRDFGFFRAYTDWKNMLEQERPDAVSLVVPVLKTADMSVEILKMGYNLITEKPPGMTAGECRSIIEAAKTSKGKLGVMFNRRYMPLVKTINEILISREIENVGYDFFAQEGKTRIFQPLQYMGLTQHNLSREETILKCLLYINL